MYAYIKGILTETGSDHIIVEAGGIGYEIFIPAQMLTELPDTGNTVKIYTHLSHREDAMVLYGFLTRDDREIFLKLIAVSGIGPKGALAILSVLSADDLRFAILSGDAKAIAKAPGVGAKTAQRVILELKDHMSLEEAVEKKSEHVSAALGKDSSVKNDAVLALTALGYSSSESLKAVSNVVLTPEKDVEAVLKEALKYLAY